MKEKNSFDPRSNRVFFKRHPVLHYNGAALAICQALTTGVESGTFRGQDPGLLNLVYKYKYISFSRGFFVTRNRPHPSREARPPRGGGFSLFQLRSIRNSKDGCGKEGDFRRATVYKTDGPVRVRELEHRLQPRRSRFAVIEVGRKFDLEQVSFFTRGGVAKRINSTRRVDIL